MDKNIFLISDASYCSSTKLCGIGVKDPLNAKSYSSSVKGVKHANEAELVALLYSIKLALYKKYENVVFVYDCKSLPISSIERFVSDKFISAQFLWLKREFTKDADKLARKALFLSRALKIKSPTEPKTNDLGYIKTFKSFSEKQILISCLYITSGVEKNIIKLFLSRNYNLDNCKKINSEHIMIFKFIYNILPKSSSESFYNYITMISPKIKNCKHFKKAPKRGFLIRHIKKILLNIKKIKNPELKEVA